MSQKKIKNILIDFKLKTFSSTHFQYCMSWSQSEGSTSEQKKMDWAGHFSDFGGLCQVNKILSDNCICPILINYLSWLRLPDLPTNT